MRNRSVPTDILLPHVAVQDVPAAIAWLGAAFGFREHYRYGDPVAGAQIHLDDAHIMLYRLKPGDTTPAQSGFATQSLTVFVPDVDAHFERAKSAGATIVEEVHVTCYGERQYAALDQDGHHWLFSQHAQDLSPADWGATLAE